MKVNLILTIILQAKKKEGLYINSQSNMQVQQSL